MKKLTSISRGIRRRLQPGLPDTDGRGQRHDERSGGDDEKGAVLILALVFLVTVSVIVGALTDWVTNDLMNTQSFSATQTLNTSATNAVTLGVQSIRYTPLLYNAITLQDQTLNASPPSYCWGSGPSQWVVPGQSSAYNMNVYCSTVWNPTSASTRKVTVSACPIARTAPITGTASWTAGQASCTASPLLQAIATIDDYPPTGVSGPSQVQCVTYCGSTISINSWNWSPTVPTVTGVTGLTGGANTFDGGQPITISGTGFTSGMTVNFVNSNPLAQVSNSSTQQIVPATNVSVNVQNQTISALSPGVTTLANYYITVSTPGGQTSAVMSNASCTPPLVDCFAYTSVAPVVSSVTPTSGYTTHSTAITIKGTGFINGATVMLVLDNGGTPNTATEGQATAVQVISNTEITALTYPFTTVGQTFFILVTTSGGASSYTGSPTYEFTQAPA